MYEDKAERTREYYRRQGAARTVDRIIQDLQADAGLQLNWTTSDLEYIVNIVEASLRPETVRPNN